MDIYAQFSDSSETTIVAIFSSPQNPETYPYSIELTASDPRYATYYASLPAWAQAGLPAPNS
jgi:hypothetical protein